MRTWRWLLHRRRGAHRGPDRAVGERLLRYCARPPFALDPLRELDPERLLYESTKFGVATAAAARPPRLAGAAADPPSSLLRRAGPERPLTRIFRGDLERQ